MPGANDIGRYKPPAGQGGPTEASRAKHQATVAEMKARAAQADLTAEKNARKAADDVDAGKAKSAYQVVSSRLGTIASTYGSKSGEGMGKDELEEVVRLGRLAQSILKHNAGPSDGRIA